MDTRPVQRRLGRRGAFLLIGGIVWVLEAVLTYRHHEPTPGFWLLSHGWQFQCAAWAITGSIAIWSAFRRQGADATGWVALYAMGAFAAIAIADGAIEIALHGSLSDLFDVLLEGGINYGILGWIIVASGWREPVTFTGVADKDNPE